MNRILRVSLGLVATLVAPFAGQAQCIFTSTATGGLFTSPTTWMVSGDAPCDTIPNAASVVIINGPVVLNTDFTLENDGATLTINSGGSLIQDGTPRTLVLGTGSGSEQLDRAVIATGARLLVSELVLEKSELTVDSAGKVAVQCNLTIDNLGIITANGGVEVNGNLNLITGNALLQGNGSLVIVGCVTGSNGALNAAIQGSLLVCVQNQPTLCGTGTCNGDVPINNDANCAAILPPLPVELTWFKAASAGTGVSLTWQTASEHDALEFLVERSATGLDFGAIGRVTAVGNSTTVHNYTWQDDRPLAGPSFYRLRQIDRNGAFAFSSVASVRGAATAKALTLWPAAAGGCYEVGPLGATATLTVLTPQGTVVHTQAVSEAGGRVSLSGCPAGIYIVRATSSLGTSTTRIAHRNQ